MCITHHFWYNVNDKNLIPKLYLSFKNKNGVSAKGNAIFNKEKFMGLYASYYSLPQEIIELCYSDVDKYFDEFDKIDFVEPNNCCHLWKLWYLMHFLCTGYTDNSKFNDKKSKEHLYLYYAFCGVYEIPIIENRGIVPNYLMTDVNFYLQQIDLRKIIKNTDIENINFDEIYPNLTIDDFLNNEFIEKLIELFENFKQFYQNALNNHRSILIAIC